LIRLIEFMRTDVRIEQFGDLPVELVLRLADGEIQLERERMVLTHSHALGALRSELMETLGISRTRGILTRMGFESGRRDAEMARRLVPNASADELLKMGPALHALEGVAQIVPLRMAIDIGAGFFEVEALWQRSHEAAIHISTHGLHDAPVCWIMQGYASGYATALFGGLVLFREIECVGRGDSCCRVVGKLLEKWDEPAALDANLLKPERVADQLVALQEQVAMLRQSLGSANAGDFMVGASPAFLRAYELLKKVADSRSTVLFLGETGVGKEMFARSLHALSSRRAASFVAVNCGALPEALVESELFGVEKGAYTGADRSRAGRFERAHGGTLFLDEVAELSASAQVKLLRVLQHGEFERMGDVRTRVADVRVVAATNRDLGECVKAGRFRADLYFRLNSFPLTIPPLRERLEDIPLLAAHFIRKVAVRDGKQVAGISEAALKSLLRYHWPGNIRELENVIERAVILTEPGAAIDLSLTPGESPFEPFSSRPDSSNGNIAALVAHHLIGGTLTLQDVEAQTIQLAVERSSGNMARAARSLGMSRRQLAYKLQKRPGG
jgi:two-component system, NtrC family, response regulator HydG